MSKEKNRGAGPDRHVPKGYDPKLYRVRHSAAHVLAQAVLERFPGVKLAIGPPVEDGFYYDFDLPRTLTPADLEGLEARMKEIVAEKHPFVRRELTAEVARELFKDQPYKLELLEGLTAHGQDEDGAPAPDSCIPVLTTYRQATFEDLCRGPHVEHTGEIPPGAIKLLKVAGAYFKGDEKRPMLQRIYGTAWETPEDLERFLWRREEAERRDHRRLGKELELFHLDVTAPGMPYWLPKGLKVLKELLRFWETEHEKRGYQEIATPLVNDRQLFERSGHWDHYRDNMFVIPVDEQTTYSVKPMNCPNAMVVYNLKTRSYRDLPLRLSDCDTLHRNERSGTLHGLLRVRKFQQDDAHIFVTEDQIEGEYDRILEIADLFYRVFGLTYRLRLGTRPEDFMGDPETWDRAEAALRRILDKHAGAGRYEVAEGDGAFYGPKVDILMEDALGRSWQMGTIQLDFQLPRRFACTYVDRDNAEKTPVVIHRVIYGSLERFIGILIEHTAGAFPVWLAPVQAVVIPVGDRHADYGRQVVVRLRDQGFRADLDEGAGRVGAKVREAQVHKIPYMLVVGDQEVASQTVSVRLRSGESLGAIPVSDFLALLRRVTERRSLGLTE